MRCRTALPGPLLDAGDLNAAPHAMRSASSAHTMIDSGDHEILAQTLTRLSERKPGQLEPLEWLVDLYGRASDSFRLPDALAQLAYAYETSGNDAKAIATYEKLLERTPEDETTRRKYMRLRAKTGLEPIKGDIAPPVKIASRKRRSSLLLPASTSSCQTGEEETQRYVTQALTDVDLFSSYGLTQKAIDLLEAVLERAPRHTPILERLLDLSVGSGNDARTAELASILEKIAIERNDRPGIERFAELRRRFQRAAGLVPADEQAKAAPPTSPLHLRRKICRSNDSETETRRTGCGSEAGTTCRTRRRKEASSALPPTAAKPQTAAGGTHGHSHARGIGGARG